MRVEDIVFDDHDQGHFGGSGHRSKHMAATIVPIKIVVK